MMKVLMFAIPVIAGQTTKDAHQSQRFDMLDTSAIGISGLYGLIRVRNDASCSGAPSGCTALMQINLETGLLTRVGKPAVTTLTSTGDLVAVDSKRGVYFYLGDGAFAISVSVMYIRRVCAYNHYFSCRLEARPWDMVGWFVVNYRFAGV